MMTVPSGSVSFLGTSSYPNTLGSSILHPAQYKTPATITAMPTRQYLEKDGISRPSTCICYGSLQVVRQRWRVPNAIGGFEEWRNEHYTAHEQLREKDPRTTYRI